MAKLGYKNASYTDFLGSQMIHSNADAKSEAKRASMLKSHNEAQTTMDFNDLQVRDSANLSSKHAWNPDSYLP